MWVLNSTRDVRHMLFVGMVRVGWVECFGVSVVMGVVWWE
jgi:hypothetical protein